MNDSLAPMRAAHGSSSAQAMLDVDDVSLSFDGFKAVNGARLLVEAGSLVAVIGPNGAGKTTLFNMISGQLKPDQGKILYRGEAISGLPPYVICKRGISRAYQLANIFPRLSVFENVQVSVLSQQRRSGNLVYPARRLAVRETDEMLVSTGLNDKARSIAGALSHGDQRILEIAIALGSRPQLLVLDEPTAGMSPEETFVTMELVKRLAQTRGITILFCEHDMEIVFAVAQSIMVMHQGRTLVQGAPADVRANPEVQAAYLGETQQDVRNA